MALTAYDILQNRIELDRRAKYPTVPTPGSVPVTVPPGQSLLPAPTYNDPTATRLIQTPPKATTTGPSYGGSSSGSSAANNAKAAANLSTLAGYNADSTKNQLHQANQNYDLADQQNRQLAGEQNKQSSKKAAADRFGQQRLLQSSAKGVLGAAGNALNGSGLGSLIDMLRNREDLDTSEVLQILTQNRDSVNNALNESLNTNVIARNDAASTAEFALRGIEADTAAQLGNIDPKLFVAPGSGAANLGSAGYADARRTPANIATSTGYFMPPPTARRPAAQAAGGSYYDTLLNSYRRA